MENIISPSAGLVAPIPTLIKQQITPEIFSGTDLAQKRFWEFFTATIRNGNTRQVYLVASYQFSNWCFQRSVGLEQVEPMIVAAYIEQLSKERAAATVKQHLAAIKSLFDWVSDQLTTV